jgi:hypothetical protein
MLFNSWPSYSGTHFGHRTICMSNSIKFYEKLCIISKMTKLDLHHSPSHTQKDYCRDQIQNEMDRACGTYVEEKGIRDFRGET